MKENAFRFRIIKEKGSFSEGRAQGSSEDNAVASSESQTRALLSIPCLAFIH